MLATLSRRFGATLLRRVAARLEEDASKPGAPGIARPIAERAAATERTLAELIEPEPAPPVPAAQPPAASASASGSGRSATWRSRV